MKSRKFLLFLLFVIFFSSIVFFVSANAEQKYRIIGSVTFPKGHFFGQTADKFAELVHKYYEGDVDIEIHYNSELGSETDAFGFMAMGVSVDFGIITPGSITSWEKTAALLSAPFVFKDIDTWKKAIHSNVLDKIKTAIEDKGVKIFGWEGGSFRDLIMTNYLDENTDLSNLQLRVQKSPLQVSVFSAIGFKPVPIIYQEVYNALSTNVIDGLENEPAGCRDMKFYEVAPYYILSHHTIATWGFMFSKKTYDGFPPDLQKAVARAGAEAADYHTSLELANYESVVEDLANKYGMTVVKFDNSGMREKSLPVIKEFAEELGVSDVLEAINAIK